MIRFQEGICHQGSRSSKVVYLSEGRVLTTGFSQHSDRQIAIWKENDLREPIKREMVDSSSGILFPYFDYDTHVLFLAGKVSARLRVRDDVTITMVRILIVLCVRREMVILGITRSSTNIRVFIFSINICRIRRR